MGKGSFTEAQAIVLGQCPRTAYKDTDAHTGLDVVLIKVVEAAVFSALTDRLLTGAVTSWAFPAGYVYEGDISAFTLASGAVIAFSRPTPASA